VVEEATHQREVGVTLCSLQRRLRWIVVESDGQVEVRLIERGVAQEGVFEVSDGFLPIALLIKDSPGVDVHASQLRP
jgi:hypothetical protein